MALRFRKSIKIAPGVRINISKSGVSTSLGPRGATVNLRNGKRKLTTSISGTGLSQQHDISPRSGRTSITTGVWLTIAIVAILAWVLK